MNNTSNFFEISSVEDIRRRMQDLYSYVTSTSKAQLSTIESLYQAASEFFTVINYVKDPVLFSDKFYNFFEGLEPYDWLPDWPNFNDIYIPLLHISRGQDTKIMHAIRCFGIKHEQVLPQISNLCVFEQYVDTYCNQISDYIVTLFDTDTFDTLPAEYKLWLADYAFDSLYTDSLHEEITDDYPLYTHILKHTLTCVSELISTTTLPDLKFKLIALHALLNQAPGWHEFFSEDLDDDYGFINNGMTSLIQSMMGDTFPTKLAVANSLNLADDYTYWKGACLNVSPVIADNMPIF